PSLGSIPFPTLIELWTMPWDRAPYFVICWRRIKKKLNLRLPGYLNLGGTELAMPSLEKKIENVLQECRILILGTQVLLGLQFSAYFEGGFAKLPFSSQILDLVALAL